MHTGNHSLYITFSLLYLSAGYCPVYSYSSEETVKPQRCTCLDSTSGCPKDSFDSKEVYKCKYFFLGIRVK